MDDASPPFMITNPNTLGLFEREIAQVAEVVHERGGLVYLDGANFNALMGVVKPGRHGCRRDAVQSAQDLLDAARRRRAGRRTGRCACASSSPTCRRRAWCAPRDVLRWSDDLSAKSIGRVRSFHGNFGMLVRAYAYIKALGGDGLMRATAMAVLNANYIRARLEKTYHLAVPGSLHARVRVQRQALRAARA